MKNTTNTYHKYCPNVFLAKCPQKYERGETIDVTTKYGKENESIVFNLIFEKNGFFYYSIVRADGFNTQEWAKRKADRYSERASTASKKSMDYYNASNKHSDFLSLGEPIKVGHHSERGHRKMIEDANLNMGKCCEFSDKADSLESKSEYWKKREGTINLSMPESIEYYKHRLEVETEYHTGLKSGKYPKGHSYSLPYAKKAVNEAQKNLDVAIKLWAEQPKTTI